MSCKSLPAGRQGGRSMDKELNSNKENKTKGFFAWLVEKIDKKMEEKAKKSPCSCSPKDGNNSCCS
jgi:hypothetical protein